MRFADILMAAATQGGAWSPAALGASLYALWDAERPDLVTESGGGVSSWKDAVGGYDAVQATSGKRPTYSLTGFNGRPVVTADGVDDMLEVATLPGSLPVGSAAGEIWSLVDQTALAADTTDRVIFSYGDTTLATGRRLARIVATGTNRAQGIIGDGVGSVSISNTTVNFSGRRVARLRIGASATQIDVDSAVGSSSAVVPNTGAVRARLFSNNGGAVGSSFFQGGLSLLAVTAPLSSSDAAQFAAFLNRRV